MALRLGSRHAAGKGGGAPKGQPNNDPPNLRELSEKDVMNVLELVRKEFNVDDRRTYLMGHSMGGAGTLYLGTKYASNWAAIGSDRSSGVRYRMQHPAGDPAEDEGRESSGDDRTGRHG